jgi:3-oxoacyl-[acyl-carrier protein] reductase
MGELTGRVVLVTGASRGIGRAIARALAREGATLELTARSEDDLQETARLCLEGGAAEARVHALDLTDGAAIDALCERLLAERDAVDVLVNNAGMGARGHALSGEPDEWERALALNVAAPMRLTRRLAPRMHEREWGVVVNVGSVAAIEGMTEAGAYAASKHALRGWSLSCYQKLRRAGIKVVLLNPAFVDTKMTEGVEGADRRRMLRPDDVAEAAMLAVRTSPACCPEEITLRLTKPPLG